MTKAAVIGLGHIGGGVAECLARAGLLGAVYDVRKDAADGFEGVPSVTASPVEVTRSCDVILIAVVTAQQTIDVLSGPQGILTAARSDLTIVLLSTVSMEDLKKIQVLTDKAGVGLVDCGVTGGQTVRQNGLVCLVGADAQRMERVRPVLEGFAKSIAHMGGPGAGMAAKIARNVVVYGCFRAGYEGAALARAAGIDIDQFVQVIEDSAEGVGSPMVMVSRPVTDAEAVSRREHFRAVMNKDLDAALDLGSVLHVALPLAELTRKNDRSTIGLPQE